jgi:peptidoglycan/LPS O-acetylase OafA/YrhL
MTQVLNQPTSPTTRRRNGAWRRRRRQPRTFRPDIEGLRAVAVLAVIAYHAGLGVRGGFVGVDVFFVISGFLITRQLVELVDARGVCGLPTFYARRIRRLLPAAAVIVLATMVAARTWAPALQVRAIAVDGIYTTFYGLNYRLAVEGTQYLHQNDLPSPLQHFWSLAVEEQFYVVWPVLILVTALVGRRWRTGVRAIALCAVAAASFYYSVTVTRTLASWAYFSLHTRGWELALGALVALGATRLARLPAAVAAPAAWLGLAAIVVSAFAYGSATPYPGSAAALPVVGTALVIAAGCGGRRGVERLLAEPMMQCVGRASYSWYLWHWPMLVLAPYVVGHPLNPLGRACVVWLSLLAALLSYFLVEDPVRRMRGPNWQAFATGFAFSGSVFGVGVLTLNFLPNLVGAGAAVSVAHADTRTPAVVRQMQQAVAAGVRSTQVPRNLTPTPDRAAHDLPAADSTNCHADFATVRQGSCVYGDPNGKHTAVLFGDSHTDMWLAAFARAGRAAHWRVVDWTKSSCPAAEITVFNKSLNRTYTECDTWRHHTIARIGRLHPDLVFVSDSENIVDSSVTDQQWTNDTLRTLTALRSASAAKVVLLQDVPVPGYDMPSCVAQHLDSLTACTFPVSKAYSFPSRHRALAAGAHAAGFAVVEPKSWICTASTCPAVVGNLLVYRDDTHLTDTFSGWLAPMVAPLLRAH